MCQKLPPQKTQYISKDFGLIINNTLSEINKKSRVKENVNLHVQYTRNYWQVFFYLVVWLLAVLDSIRQIKNCQLIHKCACVIQMFFERNLHFTQHRLRCNAYRCAIRHKHCRLYNHTQRLWWSEANFSFLGNGI